MNNEVAVCMGQIKVVFNDVEGNLSRAVEAIRRSASMGCSIVVLPETLDIGWLNPDAVELAKSIPGQYSDILVDAAKSHGVYVVAGLTERDNGKVYDSAILASPRGELMWKYRKINLTPEEQEIYEVGDKVGVVDTEYGRIGVDICIDNAPSNLVLAHSMARMGAIMILSPSGWAVPPTYDLSKESYLDGSYGKHWIVSYTTMARLYDMAIIGVSSVGEMSKGPWKGWRLIGSSLAVGPGGIILVKGKEGPNAEDLIRVNVNVPLRQIKGTRYAEFLWSRGYFMP
ncbi:MAG: carbon-nitrogen hydrolase family protein [Caldivirga sp.]|uniref:carbon-nitrogen hydrolase family protein n=1 Tax=Caldivirga sp. TaxID=2080243 RepID=UPI003D100CF1